MNSQQYEKLCRFAIADRLNIDIGWIQSVNVPSPVLPGLQAYNHQIDLYWEAENELVRYLHIANAKWRGSVKVEQGEILLLQQVKQEVNAHKAMMITSTDFTAGAKAVAEAKGIVLLVIRPKMIIKGFRSRIGQRCKLNYTSNTIQPLMLPSRCTPMRLCIEGWTFHYQRQHLDKRANRN